MFMAAIPNKPTVQLPHKYRLGLVKIFKALTIIMRPCGPGKMPGSAGSNPESSILWTGPVIGKKEAAEESNAQGMHTY